MSCPQCYTGHVNPGTPTGRWDTVYGRRTYVAQPPSGTPARAAIVIVPDAFGADFVNNQILADHYASAAQYLVYLPDFMDGKSAPVRLMLNMAHLWDDNTSMAWKPYYLLLTVYDFLPHLIRNRLGVSWPKVIAFLKDLRADKGASLPVGVAGFCWGGLHAIKLSHENKETCTADGKPLVDACFAAHPSNVSVPQDFEAVQRKLSIAIGDQDAVMGIDQVRTAQAILAKKTEVPSEVVIYPGAKHGFSIRASRTEPDSKETEQAEEAEKQALAWFQRYLQVSTQK